MIRELFVPEEYWCLHFDEVQEALLQARFSSMRWMEKLWDLSG